MKKCLILAAAAVLLTGLLAACGSVNNTDGDIMPAELPLPQADESSQFGVDKNINQATIDQWLGRDDVVYRDVRMLFDPAEYAAIGGEADLTATIKGFKVVPYPYLGTMQSLPVANAYEGDKLFEVVWAEDGTAESAKPLYEESMMIMEELFPKDKAIFLMCGGGGYAGMTKQLLICLGWDEDKLYNIGANWEYKGDNALELVVYPEDAGGSNTYATWRADYAYIEFDKLNPIIR